MNTFWDGFKEVFDSGFLGMFIALILLSATISVLVAGLLHIL